MDMAEEQEKPELLKAVYDKLAELEDLQLVNKLDIINMKNELDKASLTGGPSPELADKLAELAKIAEKSENIKKAGELVEQLQKLKEELTGKAPADSSAAQARLDTIASEIQKLKGKISSLEKRPAASPPRKGGGLEDMVKRIKKLETIRPHEADLEVPPDIRNELTELRKKVDAIGNLPKSVPKNILERMKDIGSLSSEIERLRRELDAQKSAMKSIKQPAEPDEIKERIEMLEAAVGSGKKQAEAHVPKGLDKKIERLEKRLEKLQEMLGKKGSSETKDMLEKKIERLEKRLEKLQERQEKKESGSVDEAKSMLESLKTQVMEQGKELLDIRADKSGTQNLEDIDNMRLDLEEMKARIGEIEEKAARIGVAPDALEEMRKFKGEFPLEEFHELKKKVDALEKKNEELKVLASGLKPIDVPSSGKGDSSRFKEMENRIRSLERLVGDGMNEERFKTLEKKLEEMREWLPEYISTDVKHKLDDFRKEVEEKLKELDDVKTDVVQNTIDQLLAQPQNVSRLLGEKLQKQVTDLQDKVKQIDSVVRPSEAKLTTVLRDLDEAKRQLEKEREALRDMEKKNAKDIEELSIELKALNSRLDSHSGAPVKAQDLSGIIRDIEILKTKADWLESTVHKFDLKQVHEKIEELEDRLSEHRTQTPLVIE